MGTDDETTQTDLEAVPLEFPDWTTAYLIVLASEDSTGKMFRLDPGERVIGRATEAHIRLDGPGISRKHARIVCHDDGSVDLHDLGSKNGTFVQGERVAWRRLRDGDKLQIGNTTILKLSYQDPLDLAFQATLYDSATRDGLTGAYNKRFFTESIERELGFCQRYGVPLSLVLMDVDHFKQINDGHGHLAGDAVLRRLGELMSEQVRPDAILARVGGDEFAFLLREHTHPQALAFAEQLCQRVGDEEFRYESQRLKVTVSVGVATLGAEDTEPSALVGAADQALYAAKTAGRNRVRSAA
ncbi:MAG: GGDEF domain-containing protein [Myxococcaceae bacterium]|nr:GGDEF domain-containing protein [Myxococcaceae bacterium]